MSALELGFVAINLFSNALWILLIAAPGAAITSRVISGWWYLVILGAYFGVMLAYGLWHAGWGATMGAVFPATLSSIHGVFEIPEMTAGSWTHYLADDLFVARWIFLRESDRGYRLSPIFLLCAIATPLGLLAYLATQHLRGARSHEPVHA